MATVATPFVDKMEQPRGQYGSPLARAIDRWIYVFTAASFVVIALTGFIPDSLTKIAAVQAAERPPFPLVLHMHAVLMGSFLLLLLAQTTLMATGRSDQHRRLGLAGMVIAPALVVVGFILAPTMYHTPGTLRRLPRRKRGRSCSRSFQDGTISLYCNYGSAFFSRYCCSSACERGVRMLVFTSGW